MSKSVYEYEREIALLNLKLDVSQKALGFICDLARQNPESAKFISDGTPFFAKICWIYISKSLKIWNQYKMN